MDPARCSHAQSRRRLFIKNDASLHQTERKRRRPLFAHCSMRADLDVVVVLVDEGIEICRVFRRHHVQDELVQHLSGTSHFRLSATSHFRIKILPHHAAVELVPAPGLSSLSGRQALVASCKQAKLPRLNPDSAVIARLGVQGHVMHSGRTTGQRMHEQGASE